MNMHHTLYPKTNVDSLYLPQKIGGYGLLQIQEVLEEEKKKEALVIISVQIENN